MHYNTNISALSTSSYCLYNTSFRGINVPEIDPNNALNCLKNIYFILSVGLIFGQVTHHFGANIIRKFSATYHLLRVKNFQYFPIVHLCFAKMHHSGALICA